MRASDECAYEGEELKRSACEGCRPLKGACSALKGAGSAYAESGLCAAADLSSNRSSSCFPSRSQTGESTILSKGGPEFYSFVLYFKTGEEDFGILTL